MGRILSEALRRERAHPTTRSLTLSGVKPRPTRFVLYPVCCGVVASACEPRASASREKPLPLEQLLNER